MKTLPLFLSALFFCALPLVGQNARYGPYGFTDAVPVNNTIDDWVMVSDQNSIRAVSDGRATSTELYGEREPIASASGGTAILLTEAEMGPTGFRSPPLDFSGLTEVWLGFHQYYRQNEGGRTSILIQRNGTTLRVIDLNNSLVPGAETGNDEYVTIDLLEGVEAGPNMTIEFAFSGAGYFWLIDDIGIYDAKPGLKVIPERIGRYFDAQAYPYQVDTSNWAHVPNQLVIQFNPSATQGYRDSLQQELGAFKVDSCACDFIELWEIDGSLFQSQGGQQVPATGTTGILSNIKKAKAKSKVDGVDLNKYNLTDTIPGPVGTAPNIDNLAVLGLMPEEWSAIRIAILDTGIDYTHPRIKPFVHLSEANSPGSGIDEENCLTNDGIGWNFVEKNNNPFDSNGHGTHVAGILADSLSTYGAADCTYEFVAYKTHDNNGVSTLFDVACATFQATLDDIDIINDSWGFFGDSSIILANAIDTAATRNILIVSAAGNDGIDLDTLNQYPACYAADNVITVAAYERTRNGDGFESIAPASFTNFSPSFVDVAAPGVDILSAAPIGQPDALKSGTSMSTPMVTAEAAIVYACLRESLAPDVFSFQHVKDSVIGATVLVSELFNTSTLGQALGYSESCACNPTSTEAATAAAARFEVFPNPFTSNLSLRSVSFRGGLSIRLLDASGRELYNVQRTNWAPGTTQSITLPDLKAGMYFLQLSGNGYSWTEKLLRF